MELLDKEFRGFNEATVKIEQVHEPSWITPEAGESGTSAQNRKCGEILVGYNGNFTLVCVLCMERFPTLHFFGVHIKSKHMDTETDFRDPIPPRLVKGLSLTVRNNELELTTGSRAETDQSPSTVMPSNSEHKDENLGLIGESDHIVDLNDLEPNSCHNPELSTSELHSPAQDPNTQKMTCIYCDQIFTDIKKFGDHMPIHLGRRRFSCSFCSMLFRSREERQKHINTHTGERPYKCYHCPKAFARPTNRDRHVRLMHLKLMKYKCNYCDKILAERSEKTVHEKSHIRAIKHECAECKKLFLSSLLLKKHLLSHNEHTNL